MSLANIRIILVRTFHGGNIGSAARSMKTMGLTDLCLVNPRDFPSADANTMAAGAEDMLQHVRQVDSLASALEYCSVTIASTVRPRAYDLPELDPAQAAQMLTDRAIKSPVALVFGPERMGLHNKDIELAKYRVTIPANPAYNSLNMASAVQILCYEIFKAAQPNNIPTNKNVRELPTSGDIERLHIHLEKVLRDIHFLRPHQGETLQRLRNLISRAEPDILETNIIRGILSAIEKSIDK